MKLIKNLPTLLLLHLSAFSFSQDHDHDFTIHEFENGEAWENCAIVLHQSLTQNEFEKFTREAGNIIYFQPLTAASTIGKNKFEAGLSMSTSPIDQSGGAWNNTFAHPHEDESGPHWLGDNINIPNIRFHYGITENLEVGTYITKDFLSNYGFFGLSSKYNLKLGENKTLNLSPRLSFARLFGPEDMRLSSTAVDVLFSKKWKCFEPYVGLSAAFSTGIETSNKLNLNRENILNGRALVGIQGNYKGFTASVEYDYSSVHTVSFNIGAVLGK